MNIFNARDALGLGDWIDWINWIELVDCLINVGWDHLNQVHTTKSKSHEEDNEDGADHDENAPDVSEDNLFEHVKKVDKFHDALTKDAATEEQAKEQLTADKDAADANDDAQENDEDVVMKDEEEVMDDLDINQVDAEKNQVAQSKKKSQRRGDPKPTEEEDEEETKMEGTTSMSSWISQLLISHSNLIHISLRTEKFQVEIWLNRSGRRNCGYIERCQRTWNDLRHSVWISAS